MLSERQNLLKRYSETSVEQSSLNGELRLVNRTKISERTIMLCINRLSEAFPNIRTNFVSLLVDRAQDNGMNDEQLLESVNEVIDTCHYPTPTIADFIGKNKNRKLYTYAQLIEMANKDGAEVWEKFETIKLVGKTYWVEKQLKF